MAIARKEVQDEDWKTAVTQRKKPIPAGATVEVEGIIQNMYGTYVEVIYNNTRYSIQPADIQITREEWTKKPIKLNGVVARPEKILEIAYNNRLF